MALPKLNDIPYYDVIIPSLNIRTRFRPYLVKEEKLLLMAVESNDEDEISKATINLIKACIEKDITENDLTLFDIEYLFCQIRSKSVGENVKVFLYCQNEECNEQNEVSIPLSNVGVELKSGTQKTIQLTDAISVQMKYLTYNDIMENENLKNSKTEAELIFNTIVASMNTILTEEERLVLKDEKKEDIIEFVNNLSVKQFEKLKEFVENTPQITLDVKYTCSACGHHNDVVLRGLSDFFQ
jgi:hypothetical protein